MARDLIGTRAAAEIFDCNPETLRRMYRDGAIPGYMVGRHLKLDPDELREAFRSTPRGGGTPGAIEPDFDALENGAGNG